jgi:xanthine dehydrogenase accessory factor
VTNQSRGRQRLTDRAADLAARREPYVHATVVRAQSPTSARPGDDAIVTRDGTIEGFVGGQCVKESVRTAALAALEDGEPVLLRVLPDDAVSFPDMPGARLAVNPCLSGGALEIFLEPHLPAAVVEVVGASPGA